MTLSIPKPLFVNVETSSSAETFNDLLKNEKHFHKTFHFTDDSDIIELSCSSSDSLCSETELHTCSDKCLNVKITEILDPNFGFYVWSCAPVLGKYIWNNRKDLNGKTILELGAGTALPSVVAAKCGAQVIVSDSHLYKYVLQLGAHNMQLNNISNDMYKIAELTWGVFSPFMISKQHVDLILGSDVFYDPSEFDAVLCTVSYILQKNPKSEFWCAYERRSSLWNASHYAQKWNLKCRDVPLWTFGADKFNVAGSDLPGLKCINLYIVSYLSQETS